MTPTAYSAAAQSKLGEWTAAAHDLCAPSLWGYEVASVVRMWRLAGLLDEPTADRTLAAVLALGIQEISATPERHRRALRWAERLGQRVAYDAAYLALAEELNAELWTADRRLFEGSRAAGATWVHLIQDFHPPVTSAGRN